MSGAAAWFDSRVLRDHSGVRGAGGLSVEMARFSLDDDDTVVKRPMVVVGPTGQPVIPPSRITHCRRSISRSGWRRRCRLSTLYLSHFSINGSSSGDAASTQCSPSLPVPRRPTVPPSVTPTLHAPRPLRLGSRGLRDSTPTSAAPGWRGIEMATSALVMTTLCRAALVAVLHCSALDCRCW